MSDQSKSELAQRLRQGDSNAASELGKMGAQARHNKSPEEESAVSKMKWHE